MIDLLHPPIEQIREFGFGRLQTSAADEIASHIDECDKCCEHLRTLPDDDFMERIRNLASSEVFEQLESQATSHINPEHNADEDLLQLLSDHPRYRVICQIGSGGMGEVYLAKHLVVDRTVALKVIRRAWRDHSFSHDGTARLWDVETGKTTHEIVGHQDRLAGCAFGQTPGTIITWSYDRSIRVWDIDSEKEIRKLDLWSDLQGYPHAAKVFPEHNLILSCHGDPWLRVTRFDDGVNLANQHSKLMLKGFSTSPDGRLAAAGAFRGWFYVYELPRDEKEPERTNE